MFVLQLVNGKVTVTSVGDHVYVDNVEAAYQNSWDLGGSNRNSAASTDSGRGLSANYLEPKVGACFDCTRINWTLFLLGACFDWTRINWTLVLLGQNIILVFRALFLVEN